MIGFHGGRLVSAQAPRTPKLGDLLISSGMIDRGILDSAIRSQNEELERRSLGQILVSSGLDRRRGAAPGDRRADRAGGLRGDGLGHRHLRVRHRRPAADRRHRALPERRAAGRRHQHPDGAAGGGADLRRAQPRRRESGGRCRTTPPRPLQAAATRRGIRPIRRCSTWRPPRARRSPWPCRRRPISDAPAHAAERLRLQIVSADVPFAEGLADALQHEVAGTELVPLDQAGDPEPGEPPPIVLIDLRRGGVTLEEAAALRGARTRAPRSSPWSIPAPRSPASTRPGCWRPCRPRWRRWSPASRTSSRAGATWCAARRGRTPGPGSPACGGSSATCARG